MAEGSVLIKLLIKRHCLIVIRVQGDSSSLKTERGKRQGEIKRARSRTRTQATCRWLPGFSLQTQIEVMKIDMGQ